MGCDIHVYIEHKDKGGYWYGLGSRVNPGRNYEVFQHLAGVRGDAEPVAPLRGVPEDMAYQAAGDYKVMIWKGDGDDTVTPEKAAEWVTRCGSKYIIDNQGQPRWVTHPDYHSHSWVTPDEWETALKRCDPQWPAQNDYHAILAALREFERRGETARVVFWFDN